jgi:hypothetical protein
MAMSDEAVDDGLSLSTDDLNQFHWVGVVFALITGVIHLWLGVSFIDSGLGIAFLVAGVGFLGGIAAILLDYRRKQFILLGIPFTLGQIPAWYVANAPDFSAMGIGDKVVQVLLIVVLVVLYQQD